MFVIDPGVLGEGKPRPTAYVLSTAEKEVNRVCAETIL
jgi:hypothetical protein